MSKSLLKKIDAILNGRVIKEDVDFTDTSGVEGAEDFSTDSGLEDAGVEGIEGEEEEVETLASYVAGLEDRLTDEDKENVKTYIQSIIAAAEEEAGVEGGEEEDLGASSLGDMGAGAEGSTEQTLESKFNNLKK